MNTLRVLASPRVWGPVLGIVAVLALVFYAYLGAVVSPEENLEDLPIVLVNEDRGGELAGKDVNLGDRVVERVTGPDSPAAGTVAWARPETRGEALEGMGNGEYYGAIVIPGDYTQRISSMAGQPTIQAYAYWLPLRYVIDGLCSLLFYDGALDAVRLEGGWRDSLWFLGGGGRSEAAGLEDAVWMVGAYLVSAAAVGYLISLVRDLSTRRKKPEMSYGKKPVTSDSY